MKTYRFHKNVFYKNISSTIYCDYLQCDKCINIRGLIIRYSADKFPSNLVRPDVVLRSFRLNLFVFSSDGWCMELLVYRATGKINHATTVRGQHSLPVVPPDEKRQERCGQDCVCAGIRLSWYHLQSFSLSHHGSSTSLYARWVYK